MQTLLPPPVIDYQLQLKELRQQEDHLFQLALANPQEAQLAQFEAIWNTRNEMYKEIENTMTLMPAEALEVTHCTIEEIQAIPKLCWSEMTLWGKKEWQRESQTYLCKKGVKLSENIIEQYQLTSRQVAILQQNITLEGLEVEEIDNEHEPCWHDTAYATCDRDYAYTARDIIAGRY